MDPRGSPVIVIDASYTLALVLNDESRPASAAKVAAERLTTAAVWPLEIAKALRSNLRRGRVQLQQIDGLLAGVAALEVDVAAPAHVHPRRHLEAALAYELTPDAASYLDLARQLSAGLATQDDELAAAARRAGILVHF